MITPPPLIDVSPGDPITAESWNNVLAALRLLVADANLQRGTLTVQVRDQANGNPIPDAVVTAKPTGAPTRPTRGAVYVGGDVDAHQIEHLPPGGYDVLVEADGFSPQTRSITMPETGDPLSVTVDMTVTEARFPVPSLFGVPLTQALATLTAQGFAAGRVIDSHGTEIPPAAVPADAQAAPVLGQSPAAGTLVPKGVQVLLHVSAKAEAIERVKVPDVRGLSLADAKAVLEAAGLTLGTTTTVGS
jgi:hypothetical protein